MLKGEHKDLDEKIPNGFKPCVQTHLVVIKMQPTNTKDVQCGILNLMETCIFQIKVLKTLSTQEQSLTSQKTNIQRSKNKERKIIMSLKITKQRTINAEFNVVEEGATILVKQTYISVDENAVSSVQENLINAELYAKYRKQMRKDEQELRTLRYKIEDEILAESNDTGVSNEQ